MSEMNQKGPVRRVTEKPKQLAEQAIEKPKQLAEQDDLLRGFDETGPTRGRLKGFFATSIGLSLYAWHVAFNYGAYGAVSRVLSFQDRQRLLAVSIVVLLGALIMHREVRIHKWLLFAFAPGILLALIRFVAPVRGSIPAGPRLTTEGAFRVVEAVLVVATAVSLPLVLWMVARLLAPGYFTLPGRRVKVAVVVTVATLALIGYLYGRYNYRLISCEEFQSTGEEPPANCSHQQPGSLRTT